MVRDHISYVTQSFLLLFDSHTSDKLLLTMLHLSLFVVHF